MRRFVAWAVVATFLAAGVQAQEPGVVPEQNSGQVSRRPMRISGGVMAGQVLTKVNPVYPEIAKAQGITGAVVLHAVIGKDGLVENLGVVSGPEMLRGAALQAVRQWTYKPYLLNGEPVEVDTVVTVNFNLGEAPLPAGSAIEGPVRVSGGVIAGTILTKVVPVYSQLAIDKRVAGFPTTLHVVIGKDGLVKEATVISGPELDREATINAVRHWTYRPYLIDGEPVEVETTVTMSAQFGAPRVTK